MFLNTVNKMSHWYMYMSDTSALVVIWECSECNVDMCWSSSKIDDISLLFSFNTDFYLYRLDRQIEIERKMVKHQECLQMGSLTICHQSIDGPLMVHILWISVQWTSLIMFQFY